MTPLDTNSKDLKWADELYTSIRDHAQGNFGLDREKALEEIIAKLQTAHSDAIKFYKKVNKWSSSLPFTMLEVKIRKEVHNSALDEVKNIIDKISVSDGEALHIVGVELLKFEIEEMKQ